jgi:hypothetical protein
VGLRPTAYFLRPRHGVRHIIAVRDEARPHAGADGRDGQPYRETDTRTSRDAGPYLRAVCARSEAARAARGAAPTLARRVFASGWGMAVGG